MYDCVVVVVQIERVSATCWDHCRPTVTQSLASVAVSAVLPVQVVIDVWSTTGASLGSNPDPPAPAVDVSQRTFTRRRAWSKRTFIASSHARHSLTVELRVTSGGVNFIGDSHINPAKPDRRVASCRAV